LASKQGASQDQTTMICARCEHLHISVIGL
jgi:hypothetical protein